MSGIYDEEGRKIDLDTPRERQLEHLSVEGMQDYIGWLEAEIARVKVEIDSRGSVKDAAEALFS